MKDKTSPSKPKVPDRSDDKEQSERFIETARQHGADMPDTDFDRQFKKIVAPKPIKGK